MVIEIHGLPECKCDGNAHIPDEHRWECPRNLLNRVRKLQEQNEKLMSFGDNWVCQSCGIIISRPWGTASDVHYAVECTFGTRGGKCKCGGDAWLPRAVHDFLQDQKHHLEFVANWDQATGDKERRELQARLDFAESFIDNLGESDNYLREKGDELYNRT